MIRDVFQFYIVVVCLITTGCGARFAQPPRDTITFDYVPTTEAAPGSADVTFAIVGAEFIAPAPHQQALFQQFQQQGIRLPSAPPPLLFQQLINNMTKDFEEVLTAKGYTIEGSYGTFDEMNYPNKEGSDLILTAKVKFGVDTTVRYEPQVGGRILSGCVLSPLALIAFGAASATPQESDQTALNMLGLGITIGAVALFVSSGGHKPVGRVQTVCEVDLEVYEGLTGEIMWSKKIPISTFDVTPKAMQKRDPGEITWQQLMEIDNKFYSDLGGFFELQYGKILNQIYTYLDSREMAIVKNQAMELRKRKVY